MTDSTETRQNLRAAVRGVFAVSTSIALIAGMGLGVAVSASADEAAENSRTPAAQVVTTGSVAGIVEESATGQPIAGVTVYWVKNTRPFTRKSVGVTGTDGAFAATGLVPDEYTFHAYVAKNMYPGFTYVEYPNFIPHMVPVGEEETQPGTVVAVTAGEEAATTVVMDPGASITGTLVDDRGKAYSRADTTVDARQFTIDGDEDSWGTTLRNGLTANGKFRLAPLDPTTPEIGWGPTSLYTVVVRTCDTIRGKQDCVENSPYELEDFQLNVGQEVKTDIVVGFLFEETPKPSISGTRVKGATLKAEVKDWTPLSVTRKYRWMRNGKPIGGAVNRSYTVKSKDVGKRISVRVYGYRDHFDTSGQNSGKTSVIRSR